MDVYSEFSKAFNKFTGHLTNVELETIMKLPQLKRPLNGFNHYRSKIYESIKAKNPKVDFIKVAELIFQKWCTLTNTVRALYNEKYRKDMLAYERAAVVRRMAQLEMATRTEAERCTPY